MGKIIASVGVWLAICAPCLAQSQKFALDPASPATAGGVSSADVLVPGPSIFTPGAQLGLTPGADFLNDISYGVSDDLTMVQFTVSRTTVGLDGTAVASRASADLAASDIFRAVTGGNALVVTGASLGLTQGFTGDALSAITLRSPAPFTYFALDAGSATIGAGGAGDIYVSAGSGGFSTFASGSMMGLAAGDAIDALEVFDANLNGMVDSGDFALFSLTFFSPSVLTGGVGGSFSSADILYTTFDGQFSVFASAVSLGLRDDDDVTAIQLQSVPEPASLALLALGTAAGLARGRRSRRPATPA